MTVLAAVALTLLSTRALSSDTTGAIDWAQRAGSASPMRPAPGRLLVASQQLIDPNFGRTVILLLACDASGVLGLVINRSTDVRLSAALPQLKEARDRDDVIFLGGPVARNRMMALIRSPRPLKSSLHVFEDVYASGSLDALRRGLKRATKHRVVRAYAGSAGWAPDQLDNEIARGDWYVTASDTRFVFDTDPAEMWNTLIQRVSGEWARLPSPAPRPVISQIEPNGRFLNSQSLSR